MVVTITWPKHFFYINIFRTSDMRKKSLKTRALQYAKIGFPVLPLHSVTQGGICSCRDGGNCSRPGKHPKTAHGVKDATIDRVRIEAWWTSDPHANVGIAVGAEAGILVFDIDPRNGGNKTLEKLEAELGPLPGTVIADTGGGGSTCTSRTRRSGSERIITESCSAQALTC